MKKACEEMCVIKFSAKVTLYTAKKMQN